VNTRKAAGRSTHGRDTRPTATRHCDRTRAYASRLQAGGVMKCSNFGPNQGDLDPLVALIPHRDSKKEFPPLFAVQHAPLRPAKPATKQSDPQSAILSPHVSLNPLSSNARASPPGRSCHQPQPCRPAWSLLNDQTLPNQLNLNPTVRPRDVAVVGRQPDSPCAFLVGLVRPRVIAAAALAKAGIRRP